MATWTNITTADENGFKFPVTYTDAAGTRASGKFKIKVQYDKDRTTPLRTFIRFVPVAVDSSLPDTTDGFYILYNANNYADAANAGRKLLKLKGADDGWLSATSAIEVAKKYNSETFTIQDFWICNIGQGEVDVDAQTIKYKSGTKTFYNWFKAVGDRNGDSTNQADGDRKNYVCKVRSYYLKLANYIGTPTKVACTIVDNGNNTATLRWLVELGKAEVLKSVKLNWGTTAECKESITAGGLPAAGASKTWTATKAINISSPSKATQQLYAKVQATTEYQGTTEEHSTSAAIKQYVAPPKASAPNIGADTTVKLKAEHLTECVQVSGTNSSSPIIGYIVRVYKNGEALTGLVSSKSASNIYTLTTNQTANSLEYLIISGQLPAATVKFKFSPNTLGFTAGDKAVVSIQAYTTDGTGTVLFGAESRSKEVIIKNMGTVQVKTSEGWTEGQVYVKVDGTWREAEGVYTKTDTWKESI